MKVLGFGEGGEGDRGDWLSRRAKRNVEVRHFASSFVKDKAMDVDFVLYVL